MAVLPRYRTRAIRGSGRRSAGAVRRRRVRDAFDAQVRREWSRYSRSAWRVLARELRSRFLAYHLPNGPGWALELGPGPGRFTPAMLATGARVAAVDLSTPMLRSLGRRMADQPRAGFLRRVRGAGEHLPFRAGAFRAAVAYGNILGFSGRGGEQLLAELARVVRGGGVLVLDVASPVGSATEFLESAARQRFLLRILRDPAYYFLDGIVQSKERGHQPFAPPRMGFFEFDFYTARAAEGVLSASGFRVVDRMAVAPMVAFRDRLTTLARRDPVAWENLIRLEERVGRRPGVLETGHGFVIAAVRRSPKRRPPSSRGRLKRSG